MAGAAKHRQFILSLTMSRYWNAFTLCLLCSTILLATLTVPSQRSRRGTGSAPWLRHTIDGSLSGADGIRLADLDGDGRLDIITGWEEGGITRVYLQPEPDRIRDSWPSVTAGLTPSVEDAVFVDLDDDGTMDAVSSTEGTQQTIFLHWLDGSSGYLDPDSWTTEALPASEGRMQWMYLLPLDLDQDGKKELVAGGKQENASIGWFQTGPRDDLHSWRWHPLRESGWIMSLLEADVDQDGDPDIVFTDRRGRKSGAFWLENPGGKRSLDVRWTEHLIGANGEEIMFATLVDLDQDGRLDLLAAVKPQRIFYFRRTGAGPESWDSFSISMPSVAGTAKAVAVGDIDIDGQLDLVFSCEHASDSLSGVMWMSYRDSPTTSGWDASDISGPEGTKFDLVELIDLDQDGDLDVLTCEETENLGIIWYENPLY